MMTDEYRNFLRGFKYPGWGIEINSRALAELKVFMDLEFGDRVKHFVGVKPLEVGHTTRKAPQFELALIVSHFDTNAPVGHHQLDLIYNQTVIRLWQIDWIEVGHMHENTIAVGTSIIDLDQEWLRYGMTWLVAKRP